MNLRENCRERAGVPCLERAMLSHYFITVLLFFTALTIASADEYNSCVRQPKNRMLSDIPCDLSEVTFCAAAGSAYPWQALIKFVNDNRGLMQRMYGDTSQSLLLRREIQTNKVRVSPAAARSLDLDDIHSANTENGNTSNQVDESSAGINACPSKVEVVSPYWANNTKGEMVALLNVYPFEQFIYYENCVNENHRMLCQEGCRCEQQYGLQRLLAFDPRNECRGIFSDWFRFPSCCLCRCYRLSETTKRNAFDSRKAANEQFNMKKNLQDHTTKNATKIQNVTDTN